MVTGAQEEIRYRPHLATGVHEEIPTAPLELLQENKRRRAPQDTHPKNINGKTTIFWLWVGTYVSLLLVAISLCDLKSKYTH